MIATVSYSFFSFKMIHFTLFLPHLSNRNHRNPKSDRIVQWLTRPPDTRKIPSSSLGMVISLFLRRNIAKNRLSIVLKEGDGKCEGEVYSLRCALRIADLRGRETI